jgi:hypothetical protein
VAAYQVFLASVDGRAALARGRAQARAALSHDDARELALVPAMDHGGRPLWDVLEDLAPLAGDLGPEWATVVAGAVGALRYDAQEPADRSRLLDVLGRLPGTAGRLNEAWTHRPVEAPKTCPLLGLARGRWAPEGRGACGPP